MTGLKEVYGASTLELAGLNLEKLRMRWEADYPLDEALFKALCLAIRYVAKKWTMPIREWKTVISYLAIAYGDRLGLTNQ